MTFRIRVSLDSIGKFAVIPGSNREGYTDRSYGQAS